MTSIGCVHWDGPPREGSLGRARPCGNKACAAWQQHGKEGHALADETRPDQTRAEGRIRVADQTDQSKQPSQARGKHAERPSMREERKGGKRTRRGNRMARISLPSRPRLPCGLSLRGVVLLSFTRLDRPGAVTFPACFACPVVWLLCFQWHTRSDRSPAATDFARRPPRYHVPDILSCPRLIG